MKSSDKVKIEIDLLRDSLRNIFVVMFGIMSGEIGLVYKILHNNYNIWDVLLLIVSFFIIFLLIKIQKDIKLKIRSLLQRLEE
ncbi:MAG: hypothetical protein GXO62_04605 [Epsilonproteobacteria bacterium]|nr:hypothetical protein [Campylobacterota bacterium]